MGTADGSNQVPWAIDGTAPTNPTPTPAKGLATGTTQPAEPQPPPPPPPPPPPAPPRNASTKGQQGTPAGGGRMAPPSKLGNAAADAISSPAPDPRSAATAAAAVAAAAAAREPADATPRPVGLPPGLHLPHAGRAAGQQKRHALDRGRANTHKTTRGHAGSTQRPPNAAAAAAAAPVAGAAGALPSPSVVPARMQQQQQQPAVRGGGMAACAVSDSHAAGVASSVGSNASVAWSFLRAADRLAAAFPSYTTLNLNLVEPLPMAAAAVAAGPEAGSSRWLQVRVRWGPECVPCVIRARDPRTQLRL